MEWCLPVVLLKKPIHIKNIFFGRLIFYIYIHIYYISYIYKYIINQNSLRLIITRGADITIH